VKLPKPAQKVDVARRLWKVSEQLTGSRGRAQTEFSLLISVSEMSDEDKLSSCQHRHANSARELAGSLSHDWIDIRLCNLSTSG